MNGKAYAIADRICQSVYVKFFFYLLIDVCSIFFCVACSVEIDLYPANLKTQIFISKPDTSQGNDG